MTFSEYFTVAAISGIFAACVSFAGILLNNHLQNRKDRLKQLYASIDTIIKYSIDHPYLEDDEFIDAIETHDREKQSRYDSYCCHIFNLLSQLHEYSNGKASKMNDHLFYPELLYRHRKWWEENKKNQDAYRKGGFARFVNQEISNYNAIEKAK